MMCWPIGCQAGVVIQLLVGHSVLLTLVMVQPF
jgi:hypothetical protein